MTHDDVQDLLEGYVDETLDRSTRNAVDEHLAGCDDCQAILDGVASIPLGPSGTGKIDERMLRRSLRKATLRTIVDAGLMLLGVWLALWLVAVLIVQPLVINRGGRAAAMTEATLDLATMYNPGVWVQDLEIQSTSLSRTATATVVLPVGSGTESLGEIASRIGPFGFGDVDGGSFFPYVRSDLSSPGDARTIIPELGDGTVATVALWLETPISVDEAQALADSSDHGAAVIWAGFAIGQTTEGSPIGLEEGGTLGYSTCVLPDPTDDGLFGSTSASMSRGLGFAPASISGALDRVRAALGNIAGEPAIGEALLPSVDVGTVEAAARHLSQEPAQVTVLAVTGPTAEVAAVMSALPDASASLLAVDFYNWSTPVCGRGM